MLDQLKELQKQNQELKSEMKQFEKCDPARLDKLKETIAIAKTGCERWVDNCYQVEKWIKKYNQSLTRDQLEEHFPILKDLDYVEYHPAKK